jgi:predicted secreted acid phosphatase
MRTTLLRTGAAAVAAVLVVVGLSSAPAAAHSGTDDRSPASARLAPRTQFTMKPDGSSGRTEGGAGIPNIDSVKSTIRTYYNATDGIADKSSSPYISEMTAITREPWRYLEKVARAERTAAEHDGSAGHGGAHRRKPAIVVDADDTMLWTYDMEDAGMTFVFDPALQDVYVQNQRFPATPGMVRFVNTARALGITVFGLTGRNDAQLTATLANLTKVGYRPFAADRFFTKWVSGTTPTTADPKRTWFAGTPCADGSCTTVEYKANTRRHIESLGYDIVLNVGDQWSDLQGGYADRTLKLPNPTYFLPSPDLDGTPADRRYAPRSHFRMAADGSSGRSAGGEGIPNVDIVKSTIRTYYNATNGIADKDESPYIDELAALTARQTSRLTRVCARAERRGEKPAVVLDTDDTTLWTYDMEDADMQFVFDPVVQDRDWVQPRRFPATPGMVDLVTAVRASGCTVIGLTGRNDAQKDATLGNLTKVGYTGFTSELFFTKWRSGSVLTDRPWLAGTPCADGVCTTIEYKSLTRKHVVDDLGYEVVANYGDQFSDLIGGYADRTVKLPNPTYYLP